MSLTNQDKKRLRNFGLLFFGILTGIGALKFYKGSDSSSVFFVAGAVFLVPALVYPKLLTWPEKIWMKFGDIMSSIMTRVMVSILFFVAITPMALIMKLLRRDSLKLKLDKSAKTYWEPFAKDGPGSRPFSPF